jgi:hypothetical protein
MPYVNDEDIERVERVMSESRDASQQALGRVVDLRARVAELEALIAESAAHDSWRCAAYQECHCGLDDATDRLGLLRIHCPPKG